MRSTDHNTSSAAKAARFGKLIAELAIEAGYDIRAGMGGRAMLARDIGSMSASAVGRMLDGKTLPMPHQLEPIARTLRADVRTLLVSAGVISNQIWPKDADPHVLSATSRTQPPTPEEAADMWGITEPGIRSMLVGSVTQAIRLQNEVDGRRAAEGEAVRQGR
ncbi:XRE family transcriptional regulator [Streptomyces sp. NPDC046374]|uniref:XRE family transcriptional regulator n=1 Tax=Streptomyces sp. NPDC046374 TaxID=3154917 RepID=UPI00340F059D